MNLAAYLASTDPLLAVIAVGASFAAGAGLGWLINWAYWAVRGRT